MTPALQRRRTVARRSVPAPDAPGMPPCAMKDHPGVARSAPAGLGPTVRPRSLRTDEIGDRTFEVTHIRFGQLAHFAESSGVSDVQHILSAGLRAAPVRYIGLRIAEAVQPEGLPGCLRGLPFLLHVGKAA